jgi:cobalt-precorrin 5A hydrolase / precorrin-3B C17-methyltransferase
MNVLTVSITAAGADLARRLPFAHHHGDLADTVRRQWDRVDGLVLCCATGIAVRVIGPLLAGKATDPAVVCVDDAGRWAVAVSGGHARGGNDLAREVAELLGAEAVVTTATDARLVPAYDRLPGLRAAGDIAGVTRAALDGHLPRIDTTLDWPHPLPDGPGPTTVTVTDRVHHGGEGTVSLHPPSLVVGVGASRDAPADAATTLLAEALAGAGLAPASVGLVATIDRRAGDPVIGAFAAAGLAVTAFTAAELDRVAVPHPSAVVAAEVGTASVAEAAALLAAGPDATLVVPKTKGRTATVAVARRARPVGEVAVVGLGPGAARHRTPAATAAVRHATTVIGYALYVEQCAELLSPGQTVIASPIGAEVDRAGEALRRAAGGERVALVCSGDAGVFAMATLVHELAGAHGHPPVRVVPGVTASLAAASLLGSPLAHDHALVSLSDLLTPWPVIERRVEAVAAADLAVAFYNPRSQRRTWQLARARDILAAHRPPSTPVGIVTDATRPTERVRLTTLDALDPAEVDMLSIVIVGSSTTRIEHGRMVTPRGYLS